MATSNCVAVVTAHVTKAIKAKDSTVQPPSKWAEAAGFSGSAASPLRAHIARASDNGCGRNGRYPAVTAEGMLELIELGHQFKASEGAKAEAVRKRIRTRVRPKEQAAAKRGTRQAKKTATEAQDAPKRAPRRRKAKASAVAEGAAAE